MSYLDMLTRLGVGSAHPGGFSATLHQLQQFPLPEGSRILEVGCGTGRTACYLAKQGYTITGLDIREEMLVKARARAEKEGLAISFVQGSIDALPFADGSFDVILAESVTNFADIRATLREYSRVLSPGGALYDREVMLLQPMPEAEYEEIVRFFGFGGLLSDAEWPQALMAAGFARTETWNRSVFEEHLGEDQERNPDLLQVIDQGAILDSKVWRTSIEHDELIGRNRETLGYALFIAVKGES
ncbi:class I SAM-dependent methyltransferase [Paenibacillus cremeus]|uniref:Class I SAM-dependent methyltransferase n=1 Tax=Paenibacillus cremeus TaxID=2163881 RepID=A0A559K463_9BACL|nr:class I SAM-dependent methyltransferase [Paenibacillus cremeus]TVY06880.1 class I SAM-dependent methyltransferase [Paenibacillus cremeus]